MARRSSSGNGCLAVVVLALAGIGAAINWAKDNVVIVVAIVVLGIVVWAIFAAKAKRDHQEWVDGLHRKYRDEEIVRLILAKKVWQGQTEEQLIDSWGRPDKIDRQVMKTKTKDTWKYGEIRKGQFSNRVTLENGHVTGWDIKS
ncbi:hypothetical protein [uncultured Stenotrophomonas sp.]|uniref:hypothetical protein n=1 Tax=uncultured Stenotrophomonas sp. TaxID=165438 RepID=UPI0025D3C304|nr:hypothetical protein [uncultured Stenotrophomonas sp.]